MKNFVYFEQTDGGMNVIFLHGPSELSNLYGWMTDICKYSDEYLVSWLGTAEIGDYLPHRLGYIVRLKDS